MRAQDQEPASPSRLRQAPTRAAEQAPMPFRPAMPLTPQAILHLQRTVGNAAVARLLEAQRSESDNPREDNGQPVRRSAVPGVLRSPGRPLDDDTRTEMEARLSADFSDVRLHTDAASQRSAAEIGARAYTSGNHVVIGEGGADDHTLAHELTHVVQQRQGPVAGTDQGNGLKVSDPNDRFEREAEAVATRALAMHPTLGNAKVARMLDERRSSARTSAGTGAPSAATVMRAPAEGTRKRAGTAGQLGRPSQRAKTGEDEEMYEADSESEQSDLETAPPQAMEGPAEPGVNISGRRLVPADKRYKLKKGTERRATDRAVELRMLDRAARILYAGLEKWDNENRPGQQRATPHLAVALVGDVLRVTGNTDRPFEDGHQAAAESIFQQALNGSRPLADGLGRRTRKDLTKLRALLVGDYPVDQVSEEWFQKFAKALENGIQWDIVKRKVGRAGSKIHGEMILLGQIVNEWRQRRPLHPAGASLTQVYLGGYRRPCRACQWVIGAVNQVAGLRYGFEVRAASSHDEYFSNWIAPEWLRRSNDPLAQEIFTVVKEKAEGKVMDNGKLTGSNERNNNPKFEPPSGSEYESASE